MENLRSKEEIVQELTSLVPEFIHIKNEADSYKKLSDNSNKKIKDLMSEAELDNFECGAYVLKYTVQHRESLNEDKLLGIAKKYNLDKIVKQVEVINMEALEDAIYREEISPEVLAEISKCTIVKDVPTLKVTKKKEGKK